jgi:hypothetical protein
MDAWNAIIRGHVTSWQGERAFQLFGEMQYRSDPVTSSGVLNVCASVMAIEQGRPVQEQIVESYLKLNRFVVTRLIDLYAIVGA